MNVCMSGTGDNEGREQRRWQHHRAGGAAAMKQTDVGQLAAQQPLCLRARHDKRGGLRCTYLWKTWEPARLDRSRERLDERSADGAED